MAECINENAEYVVLMDGRGTNILVDMFDIARITIREQVSSKDFENCKLVLIDWKMPYTDPWQVFLSDENIEMWKNFCAKSAKGA